MCELTIEQEKGLINQSSFLDSVCMLSSSHYLSLYFPPTLYLICSPAGLTSQCAKLALTTNHVYQQLSFTQLAAARPPLLSNDWSTQAMLPFSCAAQHMHKGKVILEQFGDLVTCKKHDHVIFALDHSLCICVFNIIVQNLAQ